MEIKFEGNVIPVNVENDGITAPAAMRDTSELPKAGVKIANMRARVNQFGGEVRRNRILPERITSNLAAI
jgi:hypothetical protein